MTENQTGIRTGRVSLKVGFGPLPGTTQNGPRYESFLVHEEDGSLYYFLGDIARTSDGWVKLAEEHRSSVIWDAA